MKQHLLIAALLMAACNDATALPEQIDVSGEWRANVSSTATVLQLRLQQNDDGSIEGWGYLNADAIHVSGSIHDGDIDLQGDVALYLAWQGGAMLGTFTGSFKEAAKSISYKNIPIVLTRTDKD